MTGRAAHTETSTGAVPAAPTASVILPTYGRPALLEEAIASVLSQTVRDVECIVIDDGSPEPVELPSTPRLRALRQPNRGPAAARNAGLSVARGQLIFFLDDDDLFLPTRVEDVLAAHERAPLVISGCSSLAAPLEGAVHDVIADTTTPHLGTVSVDRAKCLSFDESFRGCEDIDWLLRQTAATSATSIPASDWVWRGRATQLDRNAVEVRLRGSQMLLEKHAPYFATHRRALAFRLARIAELERQLDNRRAALRCAIRSLVIRPSRAALGALMRSAQPRRHVDVP